MADSVQYMLDQMVPDLNDFRNRGIFSEVEIKSIVAKRRDFEYLLRRPHLRKMDYLRYAEHEMNLEALRSLRTKRIEGARRRAKRKPQRSDFSMVLLIRRIFDRAVIKFPGDVDFWLQYIDFTAKQGSSKVLGRLFARALQFHPRNAGLWIKAASWEFFECSNANTARALLQRALRINPGARNLWLQYFRLEFHYVQKLIGRRDVLGLTQDKEKESRADVAGNKDSGEHDEQTGNEKVRASAESMDIPPVEGEEAKVNGKQSAEDGPDFEVIRRTTPEEGVTSRPEAVMNDTARKFYKGAVPLAVFRAAAAAVPLDSDFLASFLQVCVTEFPNVGDDVAKAVLMTLEEEFPRSPGAWEQRAKYHLLLDEGGPEGSSSKGLSETGEGEALDKAEEACIAVFEQAVLVVGDDPDIWVRYVSFLHERLESTGHPKKGKNVNDNNIVKQKRATEIAFRLREVLTRAQDMLRNQGEAAAGEGEGGERGGKGMPSVGRGEEDEEERKEREREGISVGLADVCMALGRPAEALRALVRATKELPCRPGLWLHRAALEIRLNALGLHSVDGDELDTGVKEAVLPGATANSGGGVGEIFMGEETLREGLKAVPASNRGYPELWRRLLAGLMAQGGGGGRRGAVIRTTFQAAVEACSPADVRQREALGEFLSGYILWEGAVGGARAARDVLAWAKKSFVLMRAGEVPVFEVVIEMERLLLDNEG
ncbi:unnamed protein product, partial [Choristocarpus tenellus]